MKVFNRIAILIFFVFTQNIVFAQDLSWEKQQRLQQYFDTNSKFFAVSKNVLDEVRKENKDFFGKYSDALVAVDILNKVANAQDWPALETALLFAEGKVIEKMYPGFASALSWASWAKTGMELLKQFVVDPALMSEAHVYYKNNRDRFELEPGDAITTIRSWGNIEQQLMVQFRSQYGDQVFKEIKASGLVLLPKWKPRFNRFVVSWFENEYQKQKYLEFQKEAMKKMIAQKIELEEQSVMIEYWIAKKLKEIDNVSITPKFANLKIGESVTFTVTATEKSGNEIDVTNNTLAQPTFLATQKGEFTISAKYKGFNVSSKVNVNATVSCTDLNEIWDETLEQCICVTGFHRNDLGICVEDEVNTNSDLICSDPNSEKIWDENLNKFVCNCKQNFTIDPNTGLCVPDVSELLNNADCANVADAVAKWDPVSQQVICTCTKNYYSWDAGQKKCIADIQAILNNSDCSQWTNTEAKWDYASEEPYCDCVAGYEWNEDYTRCISLQEKMVAQTDCSQYGNAKAIWDPVNNEVACDCLPGYEWDENYTKCISIALASMQNYDCSGYPNTEAVWDPVSQSAFCDCMPGFEWNDQFTGCEKLIQQEQQHIQYDCSHLLNSRPIFDPVLNEMVCDCMPGFEWNNNQSACIPVRNKPNIDWGNIISMTNDILNGINGGNTGLFPTGPGLTPNTSMQQPIQHQSRCNDQQQAGANTPEVHNIDLGQSFGSFMFDYNTYNAKDQIIITNGGTTIFNSGCVGEHKSIRLNLSGYSPSISVRVNPNCDGGSSTQWNFTVHCPTN